MLYIAVGLGGMVGALARYMLGLVITNFAFSTFPYGTLFVNLTGSYFLSFVAYGSLLKWKLSKNYLIAINTGMIGSFTTFSAFSLEIMSLATDFSLILTFIYIFLSLSLGLLFSWIGIRSAVKLFNKQSLTNR
ncbi:camphor resistance protein CrcB [Desulforamulus reducens MI-1]|uniref:Fluoride-specific ion channel FluC n=1 Tax=Desulforamulus reducens (strain ATCC BAA-1160 / DSM 100696 / MI-1) TaxID=349161 RepID=A4J4K8_DESRM|nr:CrcB family protein [Desulforamulus reducens]ABO50011.1 camphor resistance protein CrcB [Desulforamulus reducens MI-1]